MKVLLIFEMIPEDTKFLEIVTEDEEYLASLRKVAGTVIGLASSAESDENELNEIMDSAKKYRGAVEKQARELLTSGPYDMVVWTGIMM